MRTRCEAAEEHLQHLQSASDAVLAELERTRWAVTSSAKSCLQESAGGYISVVVCQHSKTADTGDLQIIGMLPIASYMRVYDSASMLG